MATVKIRNTTYYDISELNMLYDQGKLTIFLRDNDSESYMMKKLNSNNLRVEVQGNIERYVDAKGGFILGNVERAEVGKTLFNDGIVKSHGSQEDNLEIRSTIDLNELYQTWLKEANALAHQRSTVIRITGDLEVLNKCEMPTMINGNVEHVNVLDNLYVKGIVSIANVSGTIESTMQEPSKEEVTEQKQA